MRRAATLVLLAAAACGGTQAQAPSAPVATPPAQPAPAAKTTTAPPETASPPTRQSRLIERTLRTVELARGFQARRPVPGVLLDRPALIARVKDHVSRELPPEALRDEGLELSLFGFLPARFDYEGAEYGLLEEQLAGYYEPADGTMYMAADLGEAEAEATLAHELVHALQDQRWDLKTKSKYRPGDGDRSEALSALAEGDATSAMFDVIVARSVPASGRTALDVPDETYVDQIRAGMDSGAGAQAPAVMRGSLVAPYIYGTLFVHALRRRGGWQAVDEAWADPPATTEQILHPDKWLAREPPLPVAAPTSHALGEGWTSAEEDSEGELGVRVAFEQWVDPKTAASLSAGWGGDRGVLLRRGDQAAFAWRLRYDVDRGRSEAATTAWRTISRALEKRIGHARVSAAESACHERPDRGPLALAHNRSDLVVVLGPATVTGTSLASAGDCGLASRWVREILAMP